MTGGWMARLRKCHAPMGFRVTDVDRRVLEALATAEKVVNVGCGDTGLPHWVNMDVVPGPRVNLVADAHQMPFKDGTVDGVLMKFVLEHVRDPIRVVAEIFRVLKPGGLFFATVPFVEPFHAAPEDHQRYTVDGFRRLCRDFDVAEAGVYYGPASALVEVLREFVAAFFDTEFLKKGVRFVAGWFFLPLKYLDVYLGRKKGAHQLAYGIYVLARKPA